MRLGASHSSKRSSQATLEHYDAALMSKHEVHAAPLRRIPRRRRSFPLRYAGGAAAGDLQLSRPAPGAEARFPVPPELHQGLGHKRAW